LVLNRSGLSVKVGLTTGSACEIVMGHEVILTSAEDGWIIAECPELPGCVSQGKTEAEARANIEEAITGWLWAESLKAADSQTMPHV